LVNVSWGKGRLGMWRGRHIGLVPMQCKQNQGFYLFYRVKMRKYVFKTIVKVAFLLFAYGNPLTLAVKWIGRKFFKLLFETFFASLNT
jgi:hypothetical protein